MTWPKKLDTDSVQPCNFLLFGYFRTRPLFSESECRLMFSQIVFRRILDESKYERRKITYMRLCDFTCSGSSWIHASLRDSIKFIPLFSSLWMHRRSLVGRESLLESRTLRYHTTCSKVVTSAHIYRYLRTHSPPMSTTYVCPSSSSCPPWLLATATPVGRRNFDPWLSITEIRLPSDMLNTFRTRSVNL